MRLYKVISATLLLLYGLLFSNIIYAHLISIEPVTLFPNSVATSSTTNATYRVVNTSSITLTGIQDESIFPAGMKLLSSSTCSNTNRLAPQQSCLLQLQLQASSSATTLKTSLRERAVPTLDGVSYPITVNIVKAYTVTPNGDGNEAISPSVPQTVFSGSTQSFTVTAHQGYTLNNSVGGTCPIGSFSGSTYTTGAITSSCTVAFAATGVGPNIYAGTKYGNIFFTNSNGASWRSLRQPGGNFVYGINVLGNTIYVGGYNGSLEVSTNSGQTWAARGVQPDGSQILSVFVVNANNIYVGTANGNVAFTSNGGTSWTLKTSPDGTPVNAIYVFNGVIFVGTNNAFYFSTDGGTTWQQPPVQPGGAPILSIFILDALHYFVGTNNSVITFTNNAGASWSNTPNTNGVPSGLFIVNNTIYVGTQNGIFHTLPLSGGSWTSQSSPDGSPIDSVFVSGSTIYLGTNNGNLFTSTNGGNTWTAKTQPGGNLNYGLFRSSNGTLYVGGSNGFLLSSSTSGQTWIPSVENAGLQSQVNGVFVGGNTIYASTINTGVTISTNAGSTWNSTQIGTSTYAVFVDGGTIYESQGSNLFFSTDNGSTWQIIAAAPDGSNVNSIFILGGVIYVGTANGNVAISSNAGSSWTLTSAMPDGSQVNSVYVFNNTIYAATQNGNIMASRDGGATWNAAFTQPDGSAVLSVSVY